MLTAYLDCGAEERRLALTLAQLVPAAVEGLVGSVVLVDRGMTEREISIGDHCGCRIIRPSDLPATVEGDRSSWFLWLEAGSRPIGGWIAAVGDHVNRIGADGAGPQAARFRPARQDRAGFLERLRDRRTALSDGLVIRKPQAIGLVRQRGAAPLADLAKGMASKRLDAEIRPRRAAD